MVQDAQVRRINTGLLRLMSTGILEFMRKTVWDRVYREFHTGIICTLYIPIYILCLGVCLFVRLYPTHVKLAEPNRWGQTWVGPHMTPEQVDAQNHKLLSKKIYFRKILDYIHQHKIINPQNFIIVSSNDQATITSLSIRWYLYNLVCVYIYFYIFACKGYPQST